MGCFHTYNGKHYKNEAEVRRVIARELYQEYDALATAVYGTEEHLEGFKEYVNSRFASEVEKVEEEIKPGLIKTPTTRVISGGQTGVDRIGLEVAKELGIETGGVAPKGFKTERGSDKTLAEFGVTESTSSEYKVRTEDNVKNSDGTVYFAADKTSAGLKVTRGFATKHSKHFILNPTAQELNAWLSKNNVKTLNIAGNRGSKLNKKQSSNIRKIINTAISVKGEQKVEEVKITAPNIEPTEINATTEKIIGQWLVEDDHPAAVAALKNPIKRNAETKFKAVGAQVVMVQAAKIAEINGFNFYVERSGKEYTVFEESTGFPALPQQLDPIKSIVQAKEILENFLNNRENWENTIVNLHEEGTSVTRMREQIAKRSAIVEETVEVPKVDPGIISEFFKRAESPSKVIVYRTEGTKLNKLGTAFRGAGTYYALDNPFLTGKKGESVTTLSINIPERTTLDITSYQETGVPTNASIAYDKIYAEAARRTDKIKRQTVNTFPNMLKNVALEEGYTGIISYIEPSAPTIEAMREIGREYVEYGQVLYGETGIRDKLYKVLPKDIAVELVDDYVKVFNDGDVALGVFRESMITLSKHASDKDAFHEAFHAIFMTVLTPEQRATIYEEAKRTLGEPSISKIKEHMQERNINYSQAVELYYHEILADEYVAYRANPKRYRFNKNTGIKAFFKRILDWIKSVFTSSYTVDQLFSRINRGKYVNSKVNIYTDMSFYSKRHPEFTPEDVEDITRQLAFTLVKDVNIANRKDLEVDTSKLDDIVAAIHTRAEDKADYEMVNRAKKVYKNLPFFKKQVNDYLEPFGITEDDQVMDEDGNIVPTDKLTLDSFDEATASTRLLIALTPIYNNYATREYDTKDSYLGLPKFVNITDTWNFILRNFEGVYSFDPDVDTFQVMLEKLRRLQDVRPEMGSIADRIESSGVKAQTQFTIALTNMNNSYVTTLVKKDGDNHRIRVISSEVESDPKIIADQWNAELLDKATVEIIEGTHTYRQDYSEAVKRGVDRITELLNRDIKAYQDFNKGISEELKGILMAGRVLRSPISDETLFVFNKLLNSVGVTVDPRALKLALKDQNQESEIHALRKLLYDKEYGLLKGITELTRLGGSPVPKFQSGEEVEIDQTVILDQKAFLKLAEYEALFATDSAKVTHIGPDGAAYYGFSKHTAKAKMVEKYNKDKSNIDDVTNKPYSKHSLFAKYMKEAEGNNLKLHVPLAYKEEGNKDKGSKISNLNPINGFINSINVHLSGFFIGFAEADKTAEYYLSGPKLVKSSAQYVGNKSDTTINKEDISLIGGNQNEVVDIFIGYLADEISRIRTVQDELNGNGIFPPLEEKDLVAFYHYGKTPGDGKGKGLKNHLFPGMDLKKYGLTDTKGTVKAPITMDALYENEELREYVYNNLLNLIYSDIQKAMEYGIIVSASRGSISTDILSRPEYKTNSPIVSAMADYTINSMIGVIEDSKLFIGDPAAYEEKRNDIYGDITKRVPVNSLQGNSARVYKNKDGGWEVRPYYWSGTFFDVEKPSSSFTNSRGNLDQKVVDNVYEALATIDGKKLMTKKEVKRLLQAYVENINMADAAAYITMSARRERSKAFGHWEESTDQEIYDRITNNEMLPEDLTWMLSPMKLGHGELVTKNSSVIQHYNKQAEFVLHPYLTKGTKLENLRLAMENHKDEKGEPQPVDHMLFISGKKAGATGVTYIADENNEILPADQIKLNPQKLSYNFLVEQLPSSEKGIKPTNVGTQMRKAVKVNVSMEEDYALKEWDARNRKYVDKKVQGKDLLQMHEDAISKLSNLGTTKFLGKIGYSSTLGFKSKNPATGANYINNSRDFLYEELIKAFKGEVSENVIEALEKRMPLDAIVSQRVKIQNKVASLMNKASVKLKQRGAALVQMPDFGLTGVDVSAKDLHKSVLWFKDPAEELKMASLTKEGDVLTYNNSQVLVSMDLVRNIPGWEKMNGKEIKNAIDPEILKGIMYRIPTQGPSSLDSFDIAGILPESMGDVMISYFEITAKTGSDFDIDKVYVMYYNFKPAYNFRGLYSQIGKEFELESEIDTYAPETIKEAETLDWLVEASKESETLEEKKYRTSADGYRARTLALVAEKFYKEASGTKPSKRTEKQQEIVDRVEELKDEFFIRLEKVHYNPKKETKAGLENHSLDIIRALIEDPKSYLQTIAALDNDWMPKYAQKMFPAKTDLLPGQFWTGAHQTYLKQLYNGAKDLVGVIANHVSDHGPSQVAGLYFNNSYLGRGNTNDYGQSSLSGVKNENKMPISAILGDYMNGIVDAVKDNYITRANVNNFTAGVSFALTRSGLDEEFVMAFVGQPILFDVVMENHIENSDIINKGLFDSGRMVSKYTRAAKKYNNSITNIEEYDTSIIDFSDITLKELESQISNPTPEFQIGVLKLFKRAKEDYAKPLNDSIKASKYDTEGMGKNLTSARVMINLMTKSINDGIIGNVHKKIGIEVDPAGKVIYKKDGYPTPTKDTFISTMYNNSARKGLKVFSELFITETNAFREVVDVIASIQNPDIKLDAEAVDNIKRELYAYVTSNEDAEFVPGGENAQALKKDMFFGPNTTGKKVLAAKRAGGKVGENLLIDKLAVDLGKGNRPDLVRLNRSKKFSVETERNLFIALEELFVTDPILAEELVQNAYMTSGFINNFGSFYDVIPSGQLQNMGFTEFIEDAMRAYNGKGELLNAIRQIMQHGLNNTERSIIVPKISAQDKVAIYFNDGMLASDKISLFAIQTSSKYDQEKYTLGTNENGDVEFVRYLQSLKGDYLYELIGYKDNLPIYKSIPKAGYSKRGRVVKEYMYNASIEQSMFVENNVNLSVENAKILSKVEAEIASQMDESYREALPVDTYGKKFYVEPKISEEQIEEAKKTCE